MKTIYCNGISDVQIYNVNKKTSKRIGIAKMGSVFSARKEGNIRIIKMCNGQNVGVTEQVWSEFMSTHDSDETRLALELASLPHL